MSTVAAPPSEQRFRLSDVPWPAYLAFTDCLGERYVRVTYDQGEMEVMTVSSAHEWAKKRLDGIIGILSEEMQIDIARFGSMTCRRESLERALEPDECYWIQSESLIRGKRDLDLEADPPPDLVVEVEISRSALNRMKIYAALGVAEVWRWDGLSLRVCHLTKKGDYKVSDRSLAFPQLLVSDVERFLLEDSGASCTQWLRSFRQWVRDQIAAGWKK